MISLRDCARPETVLPGQYQAIEQIGEGVNGAIFRCWDSVGGSEVVLKRFDSQQRGAYLREMAASFGMYHRHIARCLDTFYLSDGSGWMVYEYLPDGTLRDLLAAGGPLELALVLKCLKDLLNALRHLHGLGLIHCDVKPENILLRRQVTGLADFVLGDLGAASFVREAHEGHHTTGSPAYAAPERLFDRFSYNSDLYSVGVVAFEMLTGHRPFIGSPMDIYRAQLNQSPPLEEIEHLYLRDLVEQLMLKDPHQRLPSADAALHLLACLQQGQISVEQSRVPRQCTTWQGPVRRSLHPQALLERESFALDSRPGGVLGMVCGQQPLVGLVYNQHVEFWQGGQAASIPVILNIGPLQPVTPDTLIYATGSRLVSLNVETRSRECLVDNCRQLLSFHCHDERLLWCGAEGGYLHDLYAGTVISYRSPLYFLYPQLRLLDDGWFLASAGPVNQQVVLRDASAQLLMRWNLNGPVMGWTSQGSKVLAMSMDMQSQQQYTLWHLSLDEGITQHSLASTPRYWCFSAGSLFWLDEVGDLYRCDSDDLAPRKLGPWLSSLSAFNVTPDHRFITSLHEADNGQTVATVWENMDSD